MNKRWKTNSSKAWFTEIRKACRKPSDAPSKNDKINEMAVRTKSSDIAGRNSNSSRMFVVIIQNSTQAPKVSVHLITANSHMYTTRTARAHRIETHNEAKWRKTLHSAFKRSEQLLHRASGVASREWSPSFTNIGCQRSKPDRIIEPNIHNIDQNLAVHPWASRNNDWKLWTTSSHRPNLQCIN